MTRKDYEKIAAVFNSYKGEPSESEHVRQSMAQSMADMMADENPRFDRGRFLAACGID